MDLRACLHLERLKNVSLYHEFQFYKMIEGMNWISNFLYQACIK